FVCRGEVHRRRRARVEGLEPPVRADAPAISRSQAFEAELGARAHQVVAHWLLMREELRGDPRAHRMASEIDVVIAAASVEVETGHRIVAARLELVAEHVAIAHRSTVARHGP